MTDPPTQSGSIPDDLPCVGCGYNLRTLREDALCPECGRTVADSLRSDDLRSADLKWLKRVRLGVTLAAVGFACLVLVFAVQFILVFVAKWDRSRAPFLFSRLYEVAILSFFLIPAGCFIFLTNDQRGRGRYVALPARALAVVWAMTVALEHINPLIDYKASWFFVVLPFSEIQNVSLMAGVLLALTHLRRLALRGGRQRLSKSTVVLAGVVLASSILGVAAWVQNRFQFPWSAYVWDNHYIIQVQIYVSIAMLSILAAVWLLVRYRSMLTAIIRDHAETIAPL